MAVVSVEEAVRAAALAAVLVMEAPPVVAVKDAPLIFPVAVMEDAPLTAPDRTFAVMEPAPNGAKEPLTSRGLLFVPAATPEKLIVDAVMPVNPLPLPLKLAAVTVPLVKVILPLVLV